MFEFYQEFEIILFDEAAVRRFDDLRNQRLRLGTMDLKTAAIALANNALLLSANRRISDVFRGYASKTGWSDSSIEGAEKDDARWTEQQKRKPQDHH